MTEQTNPATHATHATPSGGQLGFLLHALVAVAAIGVLNWMIYDYVPLRLTSETADGRLMVTMESFYLVFYYHFPGAINCFFFFMACAVFSILYLKDGAVKWDRHARVSGEIGLLACSITLVTGSIWAKSAWNTWWVFTDPRLMSAAVMWLTYAGYVVLQTQMEDVNRRRRYAAVFGILAAINVPFVHYAIKLLGEGQHPMSITADVPIRVTQWYGVVAFLSFYWLIYVWKIRRDRVREELEEVLHRVRRMEEGATL